jgi:N-acetyl sugar amidotransferase
MPDTRPGIKFDENGVCSACQSYERRNKINWEKRYEELEELCKKYRRVNGKYDYDCAVAVSGGKDSHYQVYLMKEVMGMNPILFTVEDNFPMTKAGIHNLKNISEEFSCNIISLKPDIKTQKKLMRYTFEKYGKPTWFLDRLIYTYPMHMAVKFNTPLLVYGENVSYEYGGSDYEETYSARGQLNNGVASDISIDELAEITGNREALEMTIAPSADRMKWLDPMYVSYFIPWNSYRNYIFSKSRGFHDLTHEWNRTHHIENFDQIETPAYLVHAWLKYPKFGHAQATDYAARYIRYGLLPREEAIKLVREHDHKLDPESVNDFINFLGYTETEFYRILESFYNKELFVKNEYGEWILKNPIWKENI